MDETRKIQCGCGQESQLVLIGGVWHYDEARHGNGEPCEGLCFNCRAPLKDKELFPVEAEEMPGTPVVPADTEGPEVVSMKMTRKELLAIAEEMELEVPNGAKKADIIELIEQAALKEQEPQDD